MVWHSIDVFKMIGAKGVQDDDFVDRLSHRYTVIILLIFCILVGSSQFLGSPIACWAPTHFGNAMVTYTNHICWVANKYFLTDEKQNQSKEYRINNYQWVPFILLLMAILFYAPFTIWRLFSQQNNVQAIMKIISSMDQSNTEAREKTIRTICKIIDRSIEKSPDLNYVNWLGRIRRLMNRSFNGAYITTFYLIIKILYISNVCYQFLMLKSFLDPNLNIDYFHVISNSWQGKEFWESPRFPRVTICDFAIPVLEVKKRYTVQCTLPINSLNEKIFLFLWFWLLLVSSFSVYRFFVWLFHLSSRSRASFIRRYLRYNDHLPYNNSSTSYIKDTEIFEGFLFNYLKQDGVFLLRIVKNNTNDFIVGELVSALWEQYKLQYRQMIE